MSASKQSDHPPFKILSLDGGGARGYLSARILSRIERHLDQQSGQPRPLGERFDLIVGTSTGGLIALGLAASKRAEEIFGHYQDSLPQIFPTARWERAIRSLQAWIRPKHRPEPLKRLAEEVLGELSLDDLSAPSLCVTGVDLATAKPRLYKRDPLTRNRGRSGERLVDIAMMTTAAPTYFPAHSGEYSKNIVDGGLCANNPALVGLTQAIEILRQPQRSATPAETSSSSPAELLERVALLSVGTGIPCGPAYNTRGLTRGGRFAWAGPISEITITSQSWLAHYQAQFLLGQNYRRINPEIPFPMAIDDPRRIQELENQADLDAATARWIEQLFDNGG